MNRTSDLFTSTWLKERRLGMGPMNQCFILIQITKTRRLIKNLKQKRVSAYHKPLSLSDTNFDTQKNVKENRKFSTNFTMTTNFESSRFMTINRQAEPAKMSQLFRCWITLKSIWSNKSCSVNNHHWRQSHFVLLLRAIKIALMRLNLTKVMRKSDLLW